MESDASDSDTSLGSASTRFSPSSPEEPAAMPTPPPLTAVSESSSEPLSKPESSTAAASSDTAAHDALPRTTPSAAPLLGDVPAHRCPADSHRRRRRSPPRRSPEFDSGHGSRESGDAQSRKRRSHDDRESQSVRPGQPVSRARHHPYSWTREQQQQHRPPPPPADRLPPAKRKRVSSPPWGTRAHEDAQRKASLPVARPREKRDSKESSVQGALSPSLPKGVERPTGKASSRAPTPPRWIERVAANRQMTPLHILSYLSKNVMNFSSGSLFVLCIRDNGFTFTNGFASHCEDRCPNIHKSLIYVVHSLDMGQVVCTDSLTYNLLKATLETLSPQNVLRNLKYCMLSDFNRDMGVCYECETECHRFRAVMGISKALKFNVKLIPHVFESDTHAPREELTAEGKSEGSTTASLQPIM